MNPLEYPKTVKLEDSKLKNLLEKKAEMIMQGREISQEIEEIEKEMSQTDKEIQKIEQTVDVSDLKKMAESITKEFNTITKRMEELNVEIRRRALKKVPHTLIDKYKELEEVKSKKEKERNKLALKAQKFKDLIIPLARRNMQPHLQDEFDDYYGLVLENDEVVGTIFNHKLDFEQGFRERRNERYKKQ